MTKQNTRREELDRRIEDLNQAIRELENAAYLSHREKVNTTAYTYHDFFVESGCVYFTRNAQRFEVTRLAGTFALNAFGSHEHAYFRRLPREVREIIERLAPIAESLYSLIQEREYAVEELETLGSDDELPPPPATISICGVDVATELPKTAEDSAISENIHGAPVRRQINLKVRKDAPMVECPLNETAVSYEWANAFRNTLAERVNARELLKDAEPVINPDGSATIINCADTVLDILGLEYTELSPCSDYTVRIENFAATMAAVDKDLIDDVKSALEEIDGTGVNELLTFANSCEEYGRPAAARAYREVAQLAACYSLRDAIEEQPELEDLLGTLFDWSNPVQLPPDVLAGIEDEYNTAREVLRTSLLSPSYLSLSGIDESISDWSSLGEDYFCNADDDDGVCAVSFHTQPSVYIEYFNGSWLFTAEGKTEVLNGYNAVTDEFQATINRFIELRGELC